MRPRAKTPKMRAPREHDGKRGPSARRATLDRRRARQAKRDIRGGGR